jgi:cytochrome c556
MINMSRFIGVAALCALLLPVPQAGGATATDKDVIEYRQRIMKSMNAQAAILGQIASYAIPNDNLAAHLDTMALLAATALKSYEPRVQGGDSKPEVWSKWPDFSARMRDFAENTAKAAKLSGTDPEAALGNMLDVLDCKSCHDNYRAKK